MESVKPRVVSPVIASADDAEKSPAKTTIASTIATELLEDATLLAKYALEMHILAEPRILERINLLQEKQRKGGLEESDFSELTDHYDLLNRITGEVTPASLRATAPAKSGYWSSIAGRHLLRLWGLTATLGVVIFLYSILGYRISYFSAEDMVNDGHLFWIRLQHYSNFLVPFTYGALGSCAYLLRIIETKLKSREFDPARIPQHWNRLVLGTLSGGMVVMFIHQTPGVETSTVLVSEGALGFLAGYSIEFLFQTLDRLITAILPKGSSETTPSPRRE